MADAFKRAIRARMRETGEGYTVARAALLEALPREPDPLPVTGSLAAWKRAVDARRK